MSQAINFDWPQGEDLKISLVYKEGSDTAKAVAVNLASGYSLKLSVFHPTTRVVLYEDESPSADISLSTGANKQPNIVVYLPRAVTLDGALHAALTSLSTFGYDMFLRNTATDKQVKILRGNLKIEKSGTQWL